MFKNISSRIILTFSSIVLAGLLLFALIAFGIFTKFSFSTDTSIMKLSARSVAETVLGYTELAKDAHDDHLCTPGTVICELYENQFIESLSKYKEDNIGVHIYDTDGTLLIATADCNESLAEELKEEADNRLKANDEKKAEGFSVKSVFHSYDEQESTLFILPIVDGENHMGYVVVSTMSNGIYAARTQLISAMVTACIWLLLGTAFSIVIVGKRITKPFREISNTVKEYSEGNTSVRLNIPEGEDEISALAQSINEMMDTIEREDKNKDTFLASVAHDLRTPMTTISGFADGILDGTIPPDRQQQYLETISEETKRLSRLVSTLLTTSKMQNQKLAPKTFNVTDKAISTLFTFEKPIDDKSLRVEIVNDEPVNVNADPDSIHQVFYNLIHNAVKFSPTGGSLIIDIQKDEANKKAVISIHNDGEGIPEDEVPHVFEKFYKTDRSRGLDKSGMGLGLFIVKTAIDNHKEKITIESGTGKGCTFTFTLPLVQ